MARLKLLPSLFFLIFSLTVMAQEVRNRDFKVKLKAAKKEAKALEKERWYTQPGALPIVNQLENNYRKLMEVDDGGNSKFFVGSGTAIGTTSSAAKMQAIELARLDIVNQIGAQVDAVVKSQIINNQINQREAESLQKTLASAKSIVSTQLGTTIPLLEIYRDVKKTKNQECAVRVAYSQQAAREILLREIQKNLTSEMEGEKAAMIIQEISGD